jgi:hypothetical protein
MIAMSQHLSERLNGVPGAVPQRVGGAANGLARLRGDQQPALSGVPWKEGTARARARDTAPARGGVAPLCAGCRQHEARYGFRAADTDPGEDRPRTLCFSCFRIELDYRQAVAARLARGWNAEQVRLPLEETLRELTRRRRRAQIAARHALGE